MNAAANTNNKPTALCYSARNLLISLTTCIILSACAQSSDTVANNAATTDDSLTIDNVAIVSSITIQTLGEKLFFDENLSSPAGQSCASCHLPEAGFADPDSHFPVSEGIVSGVFGNRNTPTASYAAFIPEFSFNTQQNRYIGGQFLDGRASTLEEQAQGPFLNPLEMNNSKQGVIDAIRASDYIDEFESIFGENSLDNTDSAYEMVAQAIAEFERTDTFSPFTSKFDAVQTGDDILTVAEQRGLNLFNGKANCNRCHQSNDTQTMFTDFSYRNLGVPANANNPFYLLDNSLNPDGINFVDLGLGGVLNEASENGKFRVPTLRNIAKTSPYMHNGIFDSLQEVIEFYNSRDTNPSLFPAEINQNVDNRIGNLELTENEILDLVEFLNTLSDGYIQ